MRSERKDTAIRSAADLSRGGERIPHFSANSDAPYAHAKKRTFFAMGISA